MSRQDLAGSGSAGRLAIGAWMVDPAADEIRRDHEVVKLEPRKMQLLLALARRPGEVVTFDELLDAVWPGVVVTQSSVYQSVAQLRKTLGDNRATPDYIATVPRKGYRLVAPVRPAESAVPQGDVRPSAFPSAAEPPVETEAGARDDRAAVSMSVPAVAQLVAAGPPRPHPTRRRWLIGSAAGVAVAGAGFVTWRRVQAPSGGDVRIAVLPFADRSAGGLDQAAADGLANDVIRRFERTDRVRVLARNSSFAFRDVTDQRSVLRAVRQQLDADYALVGDLSRAPSRVRVDVRLFALRHGDAVWSEHFEEPDERLAALPAVIARGALRSLGLPEPRPTELDPLDAYELYLLGRNALQTQKTVEGIRKARDYFQHAVETDPAYARAYAGLAETWLAQALFGVGLTIPEAASHAQPLIDRALAIDPDLLEALLVQGNLYLVSNWADAARARVPIQKAVSLYPGSAEGRYVLGVSYAYDEQPREAMRHYALAAALDPLNYRIHSRWGQDATFGGDYDVARARFARAASLMPKHPWRFLGPGQADYARGRLDDAVANYRLQLEQDPRRPDAWDELGWFYLDLGMSGEARSAFARKASMRSENGYAPIDEAHVLLAEGRRTEIAALFDRTHAGAPLAGQWELDRLSMEAIAGREPTRDRIDALVTSMRKDATPWVGSYWVFFGRLSWIDLAALYLRGDAAPLASTLLDDAQKMLDRLRVRGNVFHAIPYLEARIAALRGRTDDAFRLLGKAVDAGWRRAWVLPHDLAFARVASDPRLAHSVERVRKELVAQRAHLG